MPKVPSHLMILAAVTLAVFHGLPGAPGEYNALLSQAQAASVQNITGNFAKVRRTTIESRRPSGYTYAPSQEVKELAVRQQHRSGSWFQYIPDGTTPAPLVILFHGSGRNGLSMLDMWKDVAQQEDVILLAPNAQGRSWEKSDFTTTSLDRMLETTEEFRPIDRSRIYLFGHSNGGSFVTLLVNHFQGPWAAGATHGGFASAEHISASFNAKPFRIYLGEQDKIFGQSAAEKTGHTMARAGHSVTLQVIPNHSHWIYEIGPRIARDSWSWFRSLTPSPGSEF